MLKTFPRGGIHPHENKLSEAMKIQKLPLPEKVYIPISQHIGVPSKPLVKKGDQVKVGQVIAQSDGFVSANIHSSVCGTVEKIDKIIDGSGYKKDTVIISVNEDSWEESIDKSDTIKKEVDIPAKDIFKKVQAAGIVGLGGATFPSHVKLSVPKSKKVDMLILNGVECEPYLTSDHRLMLEKGEEIIIGAQIIKKALNTNKAVIGIENNKKDAIEHLTKIAQNYDGVEVQGLYVKYPQGAEKQLVKAITGREVPSGKLPIDVGVIAFNVGSTFAVYEAVQKNKPLIERVVTITGKSLKKPSNFWVRIGTPVSALIDAAGGLPEDTGKIINGGPMMGKALSSGDVPITKSSSGIVVIPVNESKRNTVVNCIRCSKCISVCPLGLEPYLLMALAERGNLEKMESRNILDCMECGSCSYICPSKRPLLDYIRLGKSEVHKLKRKSK